MKGLFAIIIGTLCWLRSDASAIDSIEVYSRSMHKAIPCIVITPDKQAQPNGIQEVFPVVYLLHGYSGNYRQWITLAPQLREESDQYRIILVCPDGGYSSWYFDSPVDSTIRYETFITGELIPYIDSHYPTLPMRMGRAITGLSMGGHGALYLAIRHTGLFGAAGSTSGGVDIRPFPNNWDLKKVLGDTLCCRDNWEKNTVMNLAGTLNPGELKIIFDCGLADFFLGVNRALHRKLQEMKIDHDYIERPGAHNAAYWKNSIDYQLLFFSKYFEGKL